MVMATNRLFLPLLLLLLMFVYEVPGLQTSYRGKGFVSAAELSRKGCCNGDFKQTEMVHSQRVGTPWRPSPKPNGPVRMFDPPAAPPPLLY